MTTIVTSQEVDLSADAPAQQVPPLLTDKAVAKRLLSTSSDSSGFSSRRESFDSEDDQQVASSSSPSPNPAHQMLLGTSPLSALMSSEDESASTVLSAQLSSSVESSSSMGPNKTRRRRKKKRLGESLSTTRFKDIYYTTGETLGQGSYGRVETCINMFTDREYAVKIISKANWCFSRSKVLKEIELYYLCRGQEEIIQLVEYFEEPDHFYLIFEKAHGGPLLDQIQRRVSFTEEEAVTIVRDLARALSFLHGRGIAHRDLKPENVLCIERNSPRIVKLCDFDLCSAVNQSVTTPLLQSPVGSPEYMAPEVVQAFSNMDHFDSDFEEDDELTYDKKCDLWSLGIIAYILLCGYLPFSGRCEAEGNCGWESGGECLKCQRSLFDSISCGDFSFPKQHWDSISDDAKDLISKLLVKEASQRLDASAVLEHPWILGGGSAQVPLETPSALRRQASMIETPLEITVTDTSLNSGENAMMSGGAISRGFSEFASSVLSIKRTFESPKILLSPTGNNNNNAHNRKLSHVMPRSATTQDFLLVPTRKTSAHSALNWVPKSEVSSKMRRQTSLIFPEEVNNNDRCEVR